MSAAPEQPKQAEKKTAPLGPFFYGFVYRRDAEDAKAFQCGSLDEAQHNPALKPGLQKTSLYSALRAC
jgi:hypothetical protein